MPFKKNRALLNQERSNEQDENETRQENKTRNTTT